jgi:hypothetical protein
VTYYFCLNDFDIFALTFAFDWTILSFHESVAIVICKKA